MQAEHIHQRVATLRQRDAERGQVQARGADFREQLLLLAGDVLRDAPVEQVDLVAERRILGRHRLDAHDGFPGLLVLDLRVVHQPPVLARQGSADGGVEQFLFDLRMDAQHLADAAGEGIELLGRGAGELGEQFFGEAVVAPKQAQRIGRDVVGIFVEGSGASAGHWNVLGDVSAASVVL